jgi:hypothetical protein
MLGEKKRKKIFIFSAFEYRRLCWRELFVSRAGELVHTYRGEKGRKFFDVRDREAERKVAHAPRSSNFSPFSSEFSHIPWFHPSSLLSLNPERRALGCVCFSFSSFIFSLHPRLFCQGWAGRVGSKSPSFFSCRSVGH